MHYLSLSLLQNVLAIAVDQIIKLICEKLSNAKIPDTHVFLILGTLRN